jgi:hypothetical protein
MDSSLEGTVDPVAEHMENVIFAHDDIRKIQEPPHAELGQSPDIFNSAKFVEEEAKLLMAKVCTLHSPTNFLFIPSKSSITTENT